MTTHQTTPQGQSSTSGNLAPRVGNQTWDYREAFWQAYDRCCQIRAYPNTGDLTGAVEAAYLYARMGSDPKFERDWDERPLHRLSGVVFATLQDNQRALEIMADLARRKGWAEKKRGVSELSAWKNGNDPTETASVVGLKNGLEG